MGRGKGTDQRQRVDKPRKKNLGLRWAERQEEIKTEELARYYAGHMCHTLARSGYAVSRAATPTINKWPWLSR